MIRSSVPLSKLAFAIAWVACVLLPRIDGASQSEPTIADLSAARDTEAPAAIAAPVTPASAVSNPGPAPAASPKPASHAAAPRPAKDGTTDEITGLLNLGASLTARANPDYDAADIAYWHVLKSNKASTAEIKTALLGLAHMERKRGELTKAAAIYERFLADYPGEARTPDALLDLGRTLRDLGAYRMAITRFYSVINSTLKVTGSDFQHYEILAKTAQFEIAETHFDAGEYDQANKYFTKFRLLDVAPEDRARAQFKAAYALRLDGKLEPAVTALRAFIEQCPDDRNVPEAQYLLATTLRDLKRPQEAFAVALNLLRAAKPLVSTAPRRWLHWQLVTGNQLANEFYNSGDIVDAYTIYSALLELAPDLSWRMPVTYQLGLCYERLGLNARALSSYHSVLDLGGASPASQYTELVHMAAWRIDHIQWQEKVTKKLSSIFDSTTGKQTSISSGTDNTAATP